MHAILFSFLPQLATNTVDELSHQNSASRDQGEKDDVKNMWFTKLMSAPGDSTAIDG